MQSTKWEELCGSLMSIAYLAEGCSEALREHLDGIMKMGKKIGIRTSTVEEKCGAVENIQA